MTSVVALLAALAQPSASPPASPVMRIAERQQFLLYDGKAEPIERRDQLSLS